jgi:hypothetical protein
MRREIGEKKIGFGWKRANAQRAQFLGEFRSPLAQLMSSKVPPPFSVDDSTGFFLRRFL